MSFKTKSVMIAATISLWFTSCDKTIQVGGTSDETNTSLTISGRVFDDKSHPLGGIIVKLRYAKLSDTTNGDGEFNILSGLVPDSASTGPVDTLDYLRNGAVVYSLAVPSWISTMPDVFLIQRDVSGSLTTSNLPRNFRLTASLVANSGDSISIPLEWNSDSKRYSGFLWSRFTGGLDTFRLQVMCRDSAGHLVGRSSHLAFTSLAGDVVVPAFDPLSLVPVISINAPSLLYRLDKAWIKASTIDLLGMPFTFQWKFDGGAWLDGGSDTLLPVGETSASSLVASVRARRADGLIVTDSIRIPIASFPPRASVEILDTNILPGEPLKLRFADSDTLGSKIISRWIETPVHKLVSGDDTSVTVPSDVNWLSVNYWVKNQRGDSVMANVTVAVSIPAPEFSPVQGDLDSAQTVQLRTSATNVTILVRKSGSEKWTVLDSRGELFVGYSMDLEAKAVRDSAQSPIARASYTVPVIRGELFDARDGRTYKTVRIGNLVWMAENLRWLPASESDSTYWKCLNHDSASCSSIPYAKGFNWKCLGDEATNCEKFGLLYWKGGWDSSQNFGSAITACPTGWHLSHLEEWDSLIAAIGGENAGIRLKSKTDWDGTDRYGFNALRGGYYYGGRFEAGYGSWHFPESMTDDGNRHHFQGGIIVGNGVSPIYAEKFGYSNWDGYRSVRCVQDSSASK